VDQKIGVRSHAAHPTWPVPGSVGRWESDLDQLARIAETHVGPLLIAGDFNATRYNTQFRSILDRGGLVDATYGVNGTWPSDWWPILGAQIDHVLVSADIRVVTAGSLKISGSDHRAVYTEIAR